MAVANSKLRNIKGEAEALVQHLQNHFRTRQEADGHWHYHLDDSITMNAEYIMFLKWMEQDDEDLIQRLAQFILNTQQEDGSWNLYFGGKGHLCSTIEAYFALRLAGYSPKEPALQRAKAFILKHGGIPKSRVFTKIWLALFGLYSWKGIPIIPPEIMFAPRGTPFNIYEFSYWSRTVILPLTILFHLQKTRKVDFNVDELYLTKADKEDLSFPEPIQVDMSWIKKTKLWDWKWINWEQVFVTLTRGATIYDNNMPIKPFRESALDKAKQWVLNRQDETGDWGGIVPAMMNSVMALYATGMTKDDAPVAKGMAALRRLTRGVSDSIRKPPYEPDNSATLQSCVSPVWDTVLASLAMVESGEDPQSEKLQKAKDWIWSQRITRKSDWALKAKLRNNQPFAAWCFQYHNDFYPDLDDSTVAILALHKLGMSKEELQPALNWIFAMQNSDGGWGTFDRDNNAWVLNEIPFADLKALIDPSNPDLTGHILETLGELGFGKSKSAQRAIRWLKKMQRDNGSWFGRWGVHTLYGTCAALVGLRKCGEPIEATYIQRAIQFILDSQNEDGGWGESCDNYRPNCETGVGSSTPSQTAWALMCLEACRKKEGDFAKEIEAGTKFLHSRIIEDGLEEREFTGTGFPLHFYLRYDGYRNYFPLIALGRLSQPI